MFIFAMRKELIAALTTKFAGVDAKVLGRIADNLIRNKTIETEDDVNSAVEEVTFSDILKSYGDSRAAEASKTAVSNYEKKHGLKDGKPTEQTGDPDDDDSDDNGGSDADRDKTPKAKKPAKEKTESSELATLLKAMNAKLDAQAEEIKAMKLGKVSETRKARIADVIKGLSDIQKKAYLRIPVDDLSDEDFDSLVDEITEEAGQLSKEGRAQGSVFGIPLGGNNHGTDGGKKAASDAEIEAVVAAMGL